MTWNILTDAMHFAAVSFVGKILHILKADIIKGLVWFTRAILSDSYWLNIIFKPKHFWYNHLMSNSFSKVEFNNRKCKCFKIEMTVISCSWAWWSQTNATTELHLTELSLNFTCRMYALDLSLDFQYLSHDTPQELPTLTSLNNSTFLSTCLARIFSSIAIAIMASWTSISNPLSEDTVEYQEETKSLMIFLTVLWISWSNWCSSSTEGGTWNLAMI